VQGAEVRARLGEDGSPGRGSRGVFGQEFGDAGVLADAFRSAGSGFDLVFDLVAQAMPALPSAGAARPSAVMGGAGRAGSGWARRAP
jgi:hypothetical protein